MHPFDIACTLLEYVLMGLLILILIARLTVGRTKSNACLIGKTVLITGGNAGIGYQTALALAGRGARIIIADKDDATISKENIIKYTHNNNVVTKFVDLTSLQSVRDFAKDINETEERLDILINNAGVGYSTRDYTDDGLEVLMQINHFGGFLLTHLLLGLLKKSAPSRIIFTTSLLAFANALTLDNINKSYRCFLLSYGNSKLCDIITANGFAEKLKGSGVTSNSVHPGLVHTKIFWHENLRILSFLVRVLILIPFSKSQREGAQGIINCALSTKLENTTGKLFCDCRVFIQPSKVNNKEFCEQIWKRSEELVRLNPSEKIQNI